MARAATTSDVFNAVGDVVRREILSLLAVGERTVGDLVVYLDIGQPQVSKHLKVLRDVDAVRSRTVGRHRFYRAHGPALEPLRTWLEAFTASVDQRYDRLDDYLAELTSLGETTETNQPTPPPFPED
jgi:DNA-binding transcriptional ArsR family regulator